MEWSNIVCVKRLGLERVSEKKEKFQGNKLEKLSKYKTTQKNNSGPEQNTEKITTKNKPKKKIKKNDLVERSTLSTAEKKVWETKKNAVQWSHQMPSRKKTASGKKNE